MNLELLSSAGSAFRSTFFFGRAVQLAGHLAGGHSMHRKRGIFHWLFTDVIAVKLMK